MASHGHLLLTDGAFSNDGAFHALETWDAEAVITGLCARHRAAVRYTTSERCARDTGSLQDGRGAGDGRRERRRGWHSTDDWAGRGWRCWRSWGWPGAAAAPRQDEDGDRSPAGPSAVVTPAPQPTPAATPTPAPPPDPGAPAPQPTPTPTPAAASVAYEQDIRPTLQSDCLSCHRQFANYAGTMGYVVAGNPNSALVYATQAGGSMNRYLSGDRAGKAELIRL